MKELYYDIAVVGGGPAGLAAAIEARSSGVDRVAIFERDTSLGGILQQCIHDGFGLHRFGEMLSGSAYAQRYIDELVISGVDVYLDSMVLELRRDKTIFVINPELGMVKIICKAVILAMGCRERTASQVFIYGSRPAGVMTAGQAQRYINIEGYLPGRRAVILGSGDIGLIMARRMTLEGMEVCGVYEAMKSPGGLTRNIVQCLNEYDIPLHLSATVVKIHGNMRVEGVTVAKVGSDMNPLAGTEVYIPCDTLVLAVGLIPENELSRMADIEIDSKTRGPVLDGDFMTSVPGIFAAGNVSVVFDLVDYVSSSGVRAAQGAVKYIEGKKTTKVSYVSVEKNENVTMLIPQRIASGVCGEFDFYLRVARPMRNAIVSAYEGGSKIFKKRVAYALPPEMLALHLSVSGKDSIAVFIEEDVCS